MMGFKFRFFKDLSDKEKIECFKQVTGSFYGLVSVEREDEVEQGKVEYQIVRGSLLDFMFERKQRGVI